MRPAAAAAMLCQGKLYKDMLHVIDLSSDIVPQQLTNSSFTGGYGIVSAAQLVSRAWPHNPACPLLIAGSNRKPELGGIDVTCVTQGIVQQRESYLALYGRYCLVVSSHCSSASDRSHCVAAAQQP
jgi:hypothetical protein